MHRRPSTWITGTLVFCIALGLTAVTFGDDEVKIPDPVKALKKAAKSITKETMKSGFKFDVGVQGGISKSPDHHLSETTVSKEYSAEILRGLMRVTSVDAFRIQDGSKQKGTIRDGDIWRDTLATKEGTLLMRLTNFPHLLLQSALNDPEKVEWVWVGDEEDEEEVEEDTEEQEGHTTVVKEKGERAIQKGMPHVIRVTMSPKVALEHFTETINSNCASGG